MEIACEREGNQSCIISGPGIDLLKYLIKENRSGLRNKSATKKNEEEGEMKQGDGKLRENQTEWK